MPRRKLMELGLTDDQLEAERARYFGVRQPGATRLDPSTADTHEMMLERRATFSALMVIWYAPDPPAAEQDQAGEK